MAKKPITEPEIEEITMPPATVEIDSKGQPYTLDSSNLLVELSRIRGNAESEIEAIVKSQQAINEQLQRNIRTMQERAEVEIAARQARIDDLKLVLAMVTSGLTSGPTTGPTFTPHQEPEISLEEVIPSYNESQSTGENTQIISEEVEPE